MTTSKTPAHPYRQRANDANSCCIVVVSNPRRYETRYKLALKFIGELNNAGIKYVLVEQAFGERNFMLTSHDNPYHVQVVSVDELWVKENLINIGIHRAASLGALYVSWVDADCRPAMPMRAWFEETWHWLQHYRFLQMWEYMIDLDLDHNPIGDKQPSFMSNYVKYGSPNPDEFHRLQKLHAGKFDVTTEYYDMPQVVNTSRQTLFGRPGLAWAADVEAIKQVGGLIEFSILGAGDWYMAHGLVGSMNITVGEQYSPAYAKRLLKWQERAQHEIRRDVGYVPGTVLHDFHGRKVLRGYNTRGKILRDCTFDPDEDISHDQYGQLQLTNITPRQWELRDKIRAYFQARDEDSTEGGRG